MQAQRDRCRWIPLFPIQINLWPGGMVTQSIDFKVKNNPCWSSNAEPHHACCSLVRSVPPNLAVATAALLVICNLLPWPAKAKGGCHRTSSWIQSSRRFSDRTASCCTAKTRTRAGCESRRGFLGGDPCPHRGLPLARMARSAARSAGPRCSRRCSARRARPARLRTRS